MRFAVTAGLVGSMFAVTLAQGQDLGTPVITPPILEQPADAPGLFVPPTAGPAQVAPPAAAPVSPPAAAPQPQAQPQPQPESPPPGSPGSQVDRTLTSEQFEDWTVECFEPKFEDLGCQATLRVIAGDNSQVVMVVALTGKASGPVAVQMALPLGIDLSAAVQIIVGAGYQNKVPVARCTPAGCLVEGTATPELVAALQRERSGIIVVESETGEKIQLPFSLAGFTKAFEAVLERNGG